MKKTTGVQYIKCPRCELNYIQKKDKYCDVCKSEMKAGILKESDMDDFELEEGMEICPICKVNYINPGERMCATCQEEQLESPKDDEPDWRGYVEEDNDEDLDLLPVEEDDEIDEELEGAFAKDLDDEFSDEDIDEDMEDDFEDDFDEEISEDDFDEEDEEDEEDSDDEDDDDDDFDDLPRRKRK